MDWDDLASLVGRGWTMGAHTCSHAHLPDLSIADQRCELDESAAVIASRVGVRPQALAYPYGRSSAETMQLAAQYYQAAFGTRLDFITGRSDAMHLERIDAYYLTPRLAATLDAPATRAYLGVRRLAREWLRRR